ncbi:MAG: CD1247 N-terminal domain-containing protein [Acutalibacteraceae bacterium]
MDIREKAAYVKGLLDGLELDKNDKQTKLLTAVVALLQDMAEDISDLEQSYDDVCDQYDALDETVSEIAEYCFDDEDFDDDDEESDDDSVEYEFTCPTCGKTSYVDESSFNFGGMTCPNCGETLDFDFSDDEDGTSEPEA